MNAPQRQRRDQARRGVRVVLSARDRAILAAIGRFRLVRSSDLVKFGFPGVRRDTAMRCVRRLVDGGFVAVEVPQFHAENLYSLSALGRAGVMVAGGRVGPRPRGGHEHHLLVVRTWIRLVGLQRFGLRIKSAHPDWEAREDLAGLWTTLVPDLFVVAEAAGREAVLAIEVDLGSETLAVFRRKLETYAGLLAGPDGVFGYRSLRLVVVGASPGRLRSIRGTLANLWPYPVQLWLAGSCWDPSDQDAVAWLRTPLAGSPCRKGRVDDASPLVSDLKPRVEEGL